MAIESGGTHIEQKVQGEILQVRMLRPLFVMLKKSQELQLIMRLAEKRNFLCKETK